MLFSKSSKAIGSILMSAILTNVPAIVIAEPGMRFRALQGEFYDEEEAKQDKPALRKNNVKVEDLRPQRPSERTDK